MHQRDCTSEPKVFTCIKARGVGIGVTVTIVEPRLLDPPDAFSSLTVAARTLILALEERSRLRSAAVLFGFEVLACLPARRLTVAECLQHHANLTGGVTRIPVAPPAPSVGVESRADRMVFRGKA